VDLLGPAKRVLDSHWYILGREVTEFEREFANYCGVKNCVTTANGTDALELALRALGVGPGDKVILAGNAGFYGSTAVRLVGAIPYYADIDPQTLNIAADGIREALTINPRAVIATHLYGRLADIETIIDISSQAGIPVIEDCAQAHGAFRGDRRAGSFGEIGCFSFYPTKNLGALGDGGAVVCRDESIAARLKKLRQYGWETKYVVNVPGGRNSRIDEIQAAILREKLPFLDAWNSERRAIAAKYNSAFSGLPVQCPSSLDVDYAAHLYVIQVDGREHFRGFLEDQGIATDIHYPVPDHLQPAYQSSQKKGDLPVTERACARVVSLPCFPGLGPEQVDRVIEAVRSYFEQRGF